MAALIPDEKCIVLIYKTFFELFKKQQAIIRDQQCHLQLTEHISHLRHKRIIRLEENQPYRGQLLKKFSKVTQLRKNVFFVLTLGRSNILWAICFTISVTRLSPKPENPSGHISHRSISHRNKKKTAAFF